MSKAMPSGGGARSGRSAANGRATVRRFPSRAHYDFNVIASVLDTGAIAHVGFVDGASPIVVPMMYVRWDRELVLHASVKSRVASIMRAGVSMCVAVTVLDGLVVGRSAAGNSVNYRSVVVFGTPRALGPVDKLESFRRLVEQLAPGRWGEIRPPSREELDGVDAFAVPLTEASAKIRTGGPAEGPEDVAGSRWGGVLPMTVGLGMPIVADGVHPGTPVPPSIVALRMRGLFAPGPGVMDRSE